MFKYICFHIYGTQLNKRKSVSMLEEKMAVILINMSVNRIHFLSDRRYNCPALGLPTIKCFFLYYTNCTTLHQHQHYFSLCKISPFHLILCWCYWVILFESTKHLFHDLEGRCDMGTDQDYRANCWEAIRNSTQDDQITQNDEGRRY